MLSRLRRKFAVDSYTARKNFHLRRPVLLRVITLKFFSGMIRPYLINLISNSALRANDGNCSAFLADQFLPNVTVAVFSLNSSVCRFPCGAFFLCFLTLTSLSAGIASSVHNESYAAALPRQHNVFEIVVGIQCLTAMCLMHPADTIRTDTGRRFLTNPYGKLFSCSKSYRCCW